MGFIDNIYKAFGAERGKRYTGIIAGGLPSGDKWSNNDFLKANDVSLYTNRAIARRAQKVGEIDFVMRNKKGDVLENDPIIKVLNNPNSFFDAVTFWGLHQTYIDVVGSSYIWIETGREDFSTSRGIKGLHILRPDLVKPIIEGGKVVKYTYQTRDKEIEYQPEEILHMFRPDPLNPMRGVSLLKAGIHAIQTEKQIGAYHARILENGGKIEGIMKFKTDRLLKTQLDEMKEEYAKEYADARNAGRPLFVSGDMEYENLGLTPQEMAFMDAKKVALEDIVVMTGVPKVLLGTVDNVQYSNADTSMRMFLRETINPLLKVLATSLDNKIVPDDRVLSYIDPTPENVEIKLKETENGIKNYYMTINEARERHGLEPVDNGDTIMVPFSLMPLDGTKETTPAPTDGTKSIKKATQHPLQDKDMREAWGKVSIKRADRREELFAKKLDTYFNEQRDRIIEMLQPTKTRIFRKTGLFDEITDMALEIKLGTDSLLPVLAEILREAGQDAIDLIGTEYAFNITSDITNWLEKRTNVFLTQITETTFNTLKQQFTESFEAGESREQLVERVKNTYGDITDARAKTIARTEVHNATQYATIEGYRQAGVTIKIWVAVGDAYTRDSHAALDGEERPLDVPFSNGLMFPGDPNGPAEEVINCRCVS